jgi:hypothetical protein
MAEDICAPFALCEDLDGRLLINRTADGPAIGVELADLPFGPVTIKGASLHPYVRWTYGQTWSAKEACLGPARSVLGLAPGETVTIEVTHRESIDSTRLVRDAADRTNTISKTDRRPRSELNRTPARPMDEAEQKKQQMQDKLLQMQEELKQDAKHVELQPIHYGEMGSPFFELIAGAIIGAVAGGSKKPEPTAAVDGAAKQMEHEAGGGPGTINYDTAQRIGEIVDEVERSESQSTLSESTTTTRESMEQRIVRTFTNPYRDRTLELRFFPVFRRFEITTTVVKAEPGVLLRPGVATFAGSALRARLGSFVDTKLDARAVAATALADPGDEREGAAMLRTAAVSEHLEANAALYTRRLVDHTDQIGGQDALLTPFAALTTATTATVANAAAATPAAPTRRVAAGSGVGGQSLADGLAWSRASVNNGEIHVPLADPDNLPSSWSASKVELIKGIKATIDDAKWRERLTSTRSVHLFMGTHVEAVAGTCVLADVPEE